MVKKCHYSKIKKNIKICRKLHKIKTTIIRKLHLKLTKKKTWQKNNIKHAQIIP